MIIKGLHDLLLVVIKVLLVGLPNYTPPAGVGLSVLAAANFVLPISELGLVMGAGILYVQASLGYTLILRGVKLLRGAG